MPDADKKKLVETIIEYDPPKEEGGIYRCRVLTMPQIGELRGISWFGHMGQARKGIRPYRYFMTDLIEPRANYSSVRIRLNMVAPRNEEPARFRERGEHTFEFTLPSQEEQKTVVEVDGANWKYLTHLVLDYNRKHAGKKGNVYFGRYFIRTKLK